MGGCETDTPPIPGLSCADTSSTPSPRSRVSSRPTHSSQHTALAGRLPRTPSATTWSPRCPRRTISQPSAHNPRKTTCRHPHIHPAVEAQPPSCPASDRPHPRPRVEAAARDEAAVRGDTCRPCRGFGRGLLGAEGWAQNRPLLPTQLPGGTSLPSPTPVPCGAALIPAAHPPASTQRPHAIRLVGVN